MSRTAPDTTGVETEVPAKEIDAAPKDTEVCVVETQAVAAETMVHAKEIEATSNDIEVCVDDAPTGKRCGYVLCPLPSNGAWANCDICEDDLHVQCAKEVLQKLDLEPSKELMYCCSRDCFEAWKERTIVCNYTDCIDPYDVKMPHDKCENCRKEIHLDCAVEVKDIASNEISPEFSTQNISCCSLHCCAKLWNMSGACCYSKCFDPFDEEKERQKCSTCTKHIHLQCASKVNHN